MNLDESPAAELWRRTLSQIPSLFGRLVYLSSLREANSGMYQHFGFAQRFSEREADRTLRRSHANVFADWLCFSLEEQCADMECYLSGLDQDSNTVLANWKVLSPFANLVPVSAREAQRSLFLSDLKIVMDLMLQAKSGGAGRALT